LFDEIDLGKTCLIATRGAKGSGRLSAFDWPATVTVYAFPQNDAPGLEWLAEVVNVTGSARVVAIPAAHKDLGDWVKVGAATAQDIQAAMDNAELREKDGSKDDLSWLNFEDYDELPDIEPEAVIEGLLRVGEKLGITAGTKRFKTWLLLYIAYCISNGIDFLGFKTKKAKVIFFDLELSRNGIKRRLRRIQKAVGSGDFKNLKICSLRGKASLFCQNFEKIKTRIIEEGARVVIIDPVYKFLLSKDESSNGVVADILERLTTFCMEADVASIYVHHHSKGNQAGKESLDRGSGAGAWSRDPDAILDLVEHKDSTQEERILTAEITVRDFPPIENFVVRWNFPLLERDTGGCASGS
jgi:RecA-family ATPase